MNNDYIGLVLTTTSLVFETFYENTKQCFYVKANDNLKLTPQELSFRDFIEDKIYTLSNDTVYLKAAAEGDVLPSFIECFNYYNYVTEHKSEINRSNNNLLRLFKRVKENCSKENIYIAKIKYLT